MSVNLDIGSIKSSDRDNNIQKNVITEKKSLSRKTSSILTTSKQKKESQEDETRLHVSVYSDAQVVPVPEKEGEEEEAAAAEVLSTVLEGQTSIVSESTERSYSLSLILSDLKKEKRKSSVTTVEGLLDNISIIDSATVEDKPAESPFVMTVSPVPATSPTTSARLSDDFVFENRRQSDTFSLSSGKFKDAVIFPEEFAEGSEEEVEEEEPEVDEEIEEEVQIDRNLYMGMYEVFSQKKSEEKVRNNILQNRMAAYFLRRRMFYVLKEPGGRYVESNAKYEQALEALDELKERTEYEQKGLNDDIQNMKNKTDSKNIVLDQLFDRLQQAEFDYSKTLTFERTGRQHFDKVVDRFLRRQKNQIKVLSKLRLEYIKQRNMMNDKLQALDALDHLGPGFRIMDFVQLKQDNRTLHDRLEEKEEELSKIRATCKNTMQVLAHNREKYAIMENEIGAKVDRLEELDNDIVDAREQLGYLKRERKLIREETKQLIMDNGLLTQPKMLRDMENSIREVEVLKGEIEKLKDGCYEAHDKMVAVRKNFENYVRAKERRKFSDSEFSSSTPKMDKSSANVNVPGLIVKNIEIKKKV